MERLCGRHPQDRLADGLADRQGVDEILPRHPAAAALGRDAELGHDLLGRGQHLPSQVRVVFVDEAEVELGVVLFCEPKKVRVSVKVRMMAVEDADLRR